MKRLATLFLILGIVSSVFGQSLASSYIDGTVSIALEGQLPKGFFAKATGYLPGDSLSITNSETGFSIEVMNLGIWSSQNGVALMLSKEAADKLGLKADSQMQVKLTRRIGTYEQSASGLAIVSQILSSSSPAQDSSNNIEESSLDTDAEAENPVFEDDKRDVEQPSPLDEAQEPKESQEKEADPALVPKKQNLTDLQDLPEPEDMPQPEETPEDLSEQQDLAEPEDLKEPETLEEPEDLDEPETVEEADEPVLLEAQDLPEPVEISIEEPEAEFDPEDDLEGETVEPNEDVEAEQEEEPEPELELPEADDIGEDVAADLPLKEPEDAVEESYEDELGEPVQYIEAEDDLPGEAVQANEDVEPEMEQEPELPEEPEVELPEVLESELPQDDELPEAQEDELPQVQEEPEPDSLPPAEVLPDALDYEPEPESDLAGEEPLEESDDKAEELSPDELPDAFDQAIDLPEPEDLPEEEPLYVEEDKEGEAVLNVEPVQEKTLEEAPVDELETVQKEESSELELPDVMDLPVEETEPEEEPETIIEPEPEEEPDSIVELEMEPEPESEEEPESVFDLETEPEEDSQQDEESELEDDGPQPDVEGPESITVEVSEPQETEQESAGDVPSDAIVLNPVSVEPEEYKSSGNWQDYVQSEAELRSRSFYIQILTTSDTGALNQIVREYGGKYQLSFVPLSKPGLYKVLVGPFTEDEYGAALARFKGYGYRDAFTKRTR